jgi:hypothetical protein
MVKGSQTKSCCGGEVSGDTGPQHQMCPIGTDFKRFQPAKSSDSQAARNVSSIMRAKVLSIMRDGDGGLTSLFKRFPKRLR